MLFNINSYTLTRSFPFIVKEKKNLFYLFVNGTYQSAGIAGQAVQGTIFRVAELARTLFDSYVYSTIGMLPGINPPKKSYIEIAYGRFDGGIKKLQSELKKLKKNPLEFINDHHILVAVIIFRIALMLLFSYQYFFSFFL